MTATLSPSSRRLLRHWAVAGVAALMAIAWVAISLIVPSSAQDGVARARTRDVQPVVAELNTHLYGVVGKDGRPANANNIEMTFNPKHPRKAGGIERFKHLGDRAVFLHYNDGTPGVCFDPHVVGTDAYGTSWVISNPKDVPYQNRPAFAPSAWQQKQGKALAVLYPQLKARYGGAVFQRAAWHVRGVYNANHSDSILGDLFSFLKTQPADTREAAATADLMRKVNELAAKFQTNAELLKSLKLHITPTADGKQLVQLVGSEEAKKALRQAGLGNATLTINGQPASVEQALGRGIAVDMPCQAGKAHVEAQFDAHMHMSGLYALLHSYPHGGQPFYVNDQVKLLLGPRDVQVRGAARVDVPCPEVPTTPSTPSTPETPSTPSTPDTPSTPTTPETPTTPTTPDTPATPTTPDTPATPTTPPTFPGRSDVPEIATVATWEDGAKVVDFGREAVIVDTVNILDVKTTHRYQLNARLMDGNTGQQVPGVKVEYVDGQTFKPTASLTARTVRFTVPAAAVVPGAKFVAFENLKDLTDPKLSARHEEITDPNQTVTVREKPAPKPKIGTTAANAADGSKVVAAGKDARIKDVVAIRDFAPGKYTLVGKLVDAEGQTVAGVTSQPVTFTVAEGEVAKNIEMFFTVPAAAVTGQKLVAFERVVPAVEGGTPPTYDNPGEVPPVAEHADPKDPAQTVTVREAPKASFTVSKAAVNAPSGVSAPATFTFEYYCGQGEPAQGDWQRLAPLAAGQTSAPVTGIAAGSRCYVREANANVAGAKLVTSWTVDGAAVTGAERLISDGQGNAAGVMFQPGEGAQIKVAATNTYQPTTGGFSLAKKVTDTTAAKRAPQTFTFNYVCATGSAAENFVSEGTKQVTAGAPAVVVDNNLPVGAVCAVTEADATVAGTSLATSWSVDGATAAPSSFTWGGKQLSGAVKTSPIAAGSQVAVMATNTYADDAAGFTLTKTVNSDDQRAKDASYAFTYSCVTGSASPVTGEFTLKHGQTFSSAQTPALAGLKQGSTCQIQEKKPGAIQGLEFKSVTYERVGDAPVEYRTETVGGAPALKFTLTQASKAVAFSATNSFIPVLDTPKPHIGTVLAAAEGAKEINLADAGEKVQVVDTVTYQGLVAGKTYYLAGKLVDGAGNDLGVRAVSQPFVPEGSAGQLASGVAKMTFDVPKDVLAANAKIVAFEQVWPADGVEPVKPGDDTVTPSGPESTPTAKHEDPQDPGQTVVVNKPETPAAPAKVSIVKRVRAQGMEVPADQQFTFSLACGTEGQPGAVKQQLVARADVPQTVEVPAGITCKLTEAAADVNGEPAHVMFAAVGAEEVQNGTDRSVTFKVPAGAAAQVQITAENSYTHNAPQPEVGTVATNASDGAKEVPFGADATIQDVMNWKNLPAGAYVMVPTLMKVVDGQATPVAGAVGAQVPFEVPASAVSGSVTTNIAVPAAQVVPGSKFVVFEKVFHGRDVDEANGPNPGAVPVVSHEDPADEGQTVRVTDKPVPDTTIVLKKNVEGAEVADKTFNFGIECTDSAGQPGEATILHLTAGQTSAPKKVAIGAACVIHEDPEAAAVDGSTLKLTWSANNGIVLNTVDENTTSFVVPAEGGQLVVEATNVYSPTTPETPSTPATPETPKTPETPSTPVTPDTPSTPSTPSTPATPETPKTPETPSTPSTPVTPETPSTPSTPSTPVTPSTPNTPSTPSTPATPETPKTPETPSTPSTPVTPETPSTPNTPSTPSTPTTPVVPVTPDKPVTPSTPATPTTPDTPPCTTPPATPDIPSTPGQPTTPGQPHKPGEPTTPGQPHKPGEPTIPTCPEEPTVPVLPTPHMATVAVDGADHDKVLAPGHNAIIVDTVKWQNLPAGDYVLLGTLMDKATGRPVPGAIQVAPVYFTVSAGQTEGAVTMKFAVPSQVVTPASQFVAFERLYTPTQVDASGRPVRNPNGVEVPPVLTHTDLNDPAQTVTVGRGIVPPNPFNPHQPVTPGINIPAKPALPTGPQLTPQRPYYGTTRITPLAKTGAATGSLAILAGAVVMVGAAIARMRREQQR